MIIRLDMNSEEPLYIQLMNQIKEGIAKGYLQKGEKLPSVRQLASDIGINMHTVSKAYNQLKDEGIIIINRRVGVLINEEVFTKTDNKYDEVFSKKVRALIYESLLQGYTQEEVMTKVQSIYKERNE